MIRNARADIDAAALQHNFLRVKHYAPQSRAMAVIKADAYGHGMVDAARALANDADAFAVACVAEARVLREAGISQPITVLQGFQNTEELQLAAAMNMRPVIHQAWQADLLTSQSLPQAIDIWLKLDTGMGRLGFSAPRLPAVWQTMRDHAQVKTQGLMTHFANADQSDQASSHEQFARFNALRSQLPDASHIETSLCNSAALISVPEAQGDWVRPGIMLYGSSPLDSCNADELGLTPVMRVSARLLAVNPRQRGDYVGYGSEWQCPEDMPIGVVGIGYGDGYPRHAREGTPVLVRGQRSQLLGRVSMDMLTIDLRGIEASPGDEVILWGGSLSVDEVAECASTIGYQLLCNVAGIHRR